MDYLDKRFSTIRTIYTPASPIEIKDLFSGRLRELQKAYSFIQQRGYHIIIHGDRGVGKTSFANFLRLIFEDPARQVAKVICSTNNTFGDIWEEVLKQLTIVDDESKAIIGFAVNNEKVQDCINLGVLYDEKENIQLILSLLKKVDQPIIIFDEFDRLDDSKFNKKLMADIIKAISDCLPDITILIVGVSEDVSNLIQEHESIERNMGQIFLPTMQPEEIISIIRKGEEPLSLHFKKEVIDKVIALSSGYPHFAHALCYHASYAAIANGDNEVTMQHLNIAIQETIDGAHESLRNSYRKATHATKQNIFKEVLYAASIVKADEYGYFQANDLEPILSQHLNKPIRVSNFMYHLRKFCEHGKGEILRVAGTKNRQRYKFKNPLMKAFIKLKIEYEVTNN